MTAEKLRRVLLEHDIQLFALGVIPVELNDDAVSQHDRLCHVRWMCQRALSFVDEGNLDRAGVWLGFVQGVLWAMDRQTIAGMRDLNRPDPATT